MPMKVTPATRTTAPKTPVQFSLNICSNRRQDFSNGEDGISVRAGGSSTTKRLDRRKSVNSFAGSVSDSGFFASARVFREANSGMDSGMAPGTFGSFDWQTAGLLNSGVA